MIPAHRCRPTPVAAGSCALGHVFGVTGRNVAACDKGAQDAFAHIGPHCRDSTLIEPSRRMKITLCGADSGPGCGLACAAMGQRGSKLCCTTRKKMHSGALPAVVTPDARKAVDKDAAFEVFAKRHLCVGCRGVVVAWAVELAGTSQLKPSLEVFSNCVV